MYFIFSYAWLFTFFFFSVWFVWFHLVDGLLFVFMISSFLSFLLRLHRHFCALVYFFLFCSIFICLLLSGVCIAIHFALVHFFLLFHFHLFVTERSLHRYLFCFSSFLSFVSFSSVCYWAEFAQSRFEVAADFCMPSKCLFHFLFLCWLESPG